MSWKFHFGTSSKKPAIFTHSIRYNGNRETKQLHHTRSKKATATVAFLFAGEANPLEEGAKSFGLTNLRVTPMDGRI